MSGLRYSFCIMLLFHIFSVTFTIKFCAYAYSVVPAFGFLLNTSSHVKLFFLFLFFVLHSVLCWQCYGA
uniref:Uncharacterized protein n=1 Tax=Aegilops tauschii subsp. strangulata TaxID=200361 RepID=A0A453BUL7_AEGTS